VVAWEVGCVKKASIYSLERPGREHFLDGVFGVGRLLRGGLHFYKPGEVSHAAEERHVHEDHYEVFINVQGRGVLEVEGEGYAFNTGDIYLIEPGESHHIVADAEDPLVNLWVAAERPKKAQAPV